MTPFGWSQPHDVNEHVAGIAKELRALGHSVTVLAPSARTADLIAGRRALARGEQRRRDRDRRRAARLAPVEPRRPGRRPREPPSRAPAGTLRRRPRLRARTAEHLVPRPARLGGTRRRHVLLARAARLSAAARAAREAARSHRRPPRDLPDDGRRGGGALPGRLPHRVARRRHRAVQARREAKAGRDRAPFAARCRSPVPRSARCATCPAGTPCSPDEAALDPTRDPARRCATACTSAPVARPQARAADPRRGRDRRAGPDGLGAAAARGARPPAPCSPIRPASSSSPSSPLRRSRGSSRTTRCASAAAVKARGRAEAQSFAAVATELDEMYRGLGRPAAPARARGRAARRPALDHRRPAHAHGVVARLLDRGGRAARPRGGGRSRRDRDHGPQRLRRRPRGGRAGTRTRSDRDSRRGGEDGRPGRGDRALPARGDPARHVVRRDGRRDPRAGGRRLPPPPVRPDARDSVPGDRCTGTCTRSTCSRSTTRACSSRATTTRRSASRGSTAFRRAPARMRTSSRESAPARCGCAPSTGPEEFLLSLRTAEVLRRPKSLAYLQSLKWVAQVKEKVR